MTTVQMRDIIVRLEEANRELGARVAALTNGMYVQGQAGCALAFEAGMRIAELERELVHRRAWAASVSDP